MLVGELVHPPGCPLQPPVVVLKVPDLPGGLNGLIYYLNHHFSSVLGLGLEPSIYSISECLKGALEAVDARGCLDERRARVVPDVHRQPGSHGVVGRPPGAVEVATLQGNLGYVRIMEGMPDLPEDLARGGFEVHSR